MGFGKQQFVVWAMAAAAFCAGAASVSDVAESKAEFEKSLARIVGTQEEQSAELQAAYVRRLREIGLELEGQGLVRGAVVVFDEVSRTLKTKTLPTVPASEPVDMRDVQTVVIGKWQQLTYSNEQEVVHLAGRYLQHLAQNRGDGAKNANEVDAERERVLLLPRLRAALKTTSGTPPDLAALIAAATNGTGNLKFKPLKLAPAESEELTARLNFDLQAMMAEDESRLRARKTSSALSTTFGEDGIAVYRTKFLVGARGETLPVGCRLVVTYYSRSLVERERQRESTETFELPPLAKGESTTVEGRGLAVSRSYSNTQSTRGYASVSVAGQEWYGAIIELLAPDGRSLLKRYSPQSLERELVRDAEKSAAR